MNPSRPTNPNFDAEFWRRRLVAVVQDEKTWQAELNRRRETIEAQAERLAAGERSHAALEAVRQNLADQIEAMRDVLADREREIGRLFGEVSEAHRQLHEVWSSFSWHATIPLRSISARLPGLARGLRDIGERYPRLWSASARTVRSAGRMLLLKSPVAHPPPSLPEPTPAVIPAAIELAVALPGTPHRSQRWLCVGDTIEQFDNSPDRIETGESSPVAGDHVLFTGATWISPNIGRLMSLVERGIGFSLFVDNVVPLEPAAAWLRMVLTHARCVCVSGATMRDQILRWAVLSDVYVSAAVELGTAASDASAARLETFGPVTPLEQPGRLFLPGIVAPAELPTLEAAQAWCTEDDPQVSILIVNRNAYQLTRACIQQVWANTSGVRYEIMVADGSSSPTDCRALSALGRGVRLLPVGADRFFGEACNIAAEHAQAPLLCLLGNDCFGQPGWLKILFAALETDPSAGAAGPLFLSPDMTVQESGGAITERGFQAPFGQGDELELQPRSVDYVSAAALLVRRDAYLRAGGLDLMYEPLAYEDVDLCFKLRALGLSVRSCPSAHAIRIEGKDDAPAADARRKALVDLNRTKFVSRWGPFLRTRSDADLAAIRQQIVLDASATPAPDPALSTAMFYTPYPITPGGGERFLLTMASELVRDHRVTIVTPHPYSQLRLQSIAHTFGLDLSRCLMQTDAEFAKGAPPDLMVVLGNYIYPPIAPRTPNAVFICQFPFPMVGHPRRIDQGYRAVIAYSDYARTHILAALSADQMPRWPVEIVYPPVPQVVADRALKRPIILTVGRFFTGGHNKRHDLMITAFRRVLETLGGEVEMHLAGSSTPGPEHMRYLETLMQRAEGMPVTFHVNASRETLEDLYRRAAIYWHATGLGGDLANHPELAEHFGISLVEAMSGECVPMAFDAGGPREIITQGVDGFLYASVDELVTLTANILHPDAAARRQAIGHAASERARAFAPERFSERVREVLLTSAVV